MFLLWNSSGETDLVQIMTWLSSTFFKSITVYVQMITEMVQ